MTLARPVFRLLFRLPTRRGHASSRKPLAWPQAAPFWHWQQFRRRRPPPHPRWTQSGAPSRSNPPVHTRRVFFIEFEYQQP